MITVIRFMLGHPLCQKQHRIGAFRRFCSWQLASRILKRPIIVPFTANTSIILERGYPSGTGNFYCGLYEFEDMAFVINLLRPDDLFVDVGANIGTYSVLASGQCGAKSVAFEPLPNTFERLVANVRYNDLESLVTLHNCGLGDAETSLRFTANLGTRNHVATPSDQHTIEVPVRRLDGILADQKPLCIKIDVEGFEKNVLEGGRTTLQNDSVRAVLMEVKGHGKRFGADDDTINGMMLSFGFEPFSYDPMSRVLQPLAGQQEYSGNILYLRDVPFVRKRVTEAPEIELPWRRIERP